MKLLALAVALFSAAAAIIAQETGEPLVTFLAVVGFICAFTTYRSHAISSFLKIFAAIFAAETFIFGSIFLLSKVDLWPKDLEDYLLPESLPITVAAFAILVYLVSFIPVVRSMTRIADRYFDTADKNPARVWPFPSFTGYERHIAAAMVVILVAINQAQVGIEVRLTFFSRDWFNAIQNKDEATFWYQLLFVFCPWAFLSIATQVVEFVIQSTLIIRWRRWLTDYYVNHWLTGHTHYRMSLVGAGADNPDQRISEDISRFIDGGQVGYGIYSFSILLISKLSSLISFAIILWDLSQNFTLPYTTIAVPGFLFWVALIYAGIGTVFTHLIGRPLVNLSFVRQRCEADFRFSLARLREYGEQVALLSGEAAEQKTLSRLFSAIIHNYFAIIGCRKRLISFTATYGQLSPLIPYIISAPFYFSGKITLGIMTQTARAFANVDAALTFFITYYVSLADFKSVLDRLTSFDAALDRAHAFGTGLRKNAEASSDEKNLDIAAFTLELPDGRVIVQSSDLQFAANQPVLLTGPSGSGKSTLFRAISGIWPFGEGTITLPANSSVMLLPQKPYLPTGTLKAAVTYPSLPDDFDDETVREVLTAAQLDHFIDKIGVEEIWSQCLSGGEQQRVSLARALLAKPDWLFLDEATAAMEESMEAKIYETLAEKLPDTTIVSIGHRTSLARFHKRYLAMHPAGTTGLFTPSEHVVKAAE
jgi:vitamin B12/bleomycin/antimicrobial peptide transport system ATP-binding/permease protein